LRLALKTLSAYLRRCSLWSANAVALRGDVHFSTGCGGCHRSLPTGGAA
jgi:hypothetical protein